MGDPTVFAGAGSGDPRRTSARAGERVARESGDSRQADVRGQNQPVRHPDRALPELGPGVRSASSLEGGQEGSMVGQTGRSAPTVLKRRQTALVLDVSIASIVADAQARTSFVAFRPLPGSHITIRCFWITSPTHDSAPGVREARG